ncbi:Dps family protein [Paucilactobacillus suebicus]|uniref:DNA-binding ferritin-like protein (Oxidative damage protectant) n=1 Tax=Paucilactobacillus suebicus DSM 5007 = KCTC 3549 TaxID=1423807 RepID=A0A0R1W1Y4_9LACO|nr:Dps family protein [Paucilactobacillus suebicus]KRM11872.1 DNA-binding ferritin-like protein (oxidative damage protectant) [Paucilactobacillus suebicus DSM 5007 = KCTC 3549]
MAEAKYPKTMAQLNQLIADISQLQTNVQQTHWYMRGSEFFRLHPQMDDYNEELDEHLDEIAERLIALGGSPYSTTHEFIEHTGLPDEKVTWNQHTLPEYMQRLDDQFKYLANQYQIGMEASDEEKDFPTQDMLNGFKETIDKYIWMISAYLGKGPLE